MRTFEQLLARARAMPPSRVAVAQAADGNVLLALHDAHREGFIEPILVGDSAAVAEAAGKADVDVSTWRLVESSPQDAPAAAVSLVRQGQADLLMKGLVQTADLLRAVLDKERGLRTGRALSHVIALEVPGYDRLLFVTDAAMNVAPDLARKADILVNCLAVTSALGLSRPRVACLAAVETVNTDMPATVDAALLSKMAERGQIPGAVVDGPLALDNAISEEAAAHKGIVSPVAGKADVLLVPDIEAGNMLYKSMVYFARARAAGIVVGAKCPVVLLSRADTSEAKLYSLALARVAAGG